MAPAKTLGGDPGENRRGRGPLGGGGLSSAAPWCPERGRSAATPWWRCGWGGGTRRPLGRKEGARPDRHTGPGAVAEPASRSRRAGGAGKAGRLLSHHEAVSP
jgi:hypothetical protein